MKLFKNPKETIRIKKEYITYYYEYSCPFCKTTFNVHGLGEEVLVIKCSHCNNKIKFKE